VDPPRTLSNRATTSLLRVAVMPSIAWRSVGRMTSFASVFGSASQASRFQAMTSPVRKVWPDGAVQSCLVVTISWPWTRASMSDLAGSSSFVVVPSALSRQVSPS
jgi:hypothetical protein